MTTTLAITDTVVTLSSPLLLGGGGVLPRCRVAIRIAGNPASPAVLVLGGISATRRVVAAETEAEPGWWEAVVDRSAALGRGSRCLVGADFLAGPGDSSAPRPGLLLGTADQAEAIARACVESGIPRFEAAIGASYGGMVALALAGRRPELVGRVIAISAAGSSHPMASAHRWIQREIVRLGCAAGKPAEGVALARALAMTTYRSANEFQDRFGSGPGGALRVRQYLASRGRSFSGRFRPEQVVRLSRSLDAHDVDPAALTVPIHLIGVSSDTLVPPWQVAALSRRLGALSTLTILDSPWGHDAFLKEPETMAALIDTHLSTGRNP